MYIFFSVIRKYNQSQTWPQIPPDKPFRERSSMSQFLPRNRLRQKPSTNDLFHGRRYDTGLIPLKGTGEEEFRAKSVVGFTMLYYSYYGNGSVKALRLQVKKISKVCVSEERSLKTKVLKVNQVQLIVYHLKDSLYNLVQAQLLYQRKHGVSSCAT